MFQERCKPGRSCWPTVVLFVLAVLGPSGASGMKVSMEAAAEIVIRHIVGKGTTSCAVNVEVHPIPLPADAIVVDVADLEFSKGEAGSYPNPFQESWFFLIDDYPNANWGHECRYVWVDSETGNYKVVDENFPPSFFPEKVLELKLIYKSISPEAVRRMLAQEVILEAILEGDSTTATLYMTPICLRYEASESIVDVKEKEYPNPFLLGWFFFIDDRPYASWPHPCRYVWVETQTGNYEVVNGEWPPCNLDQLQELIEPQPIEVGVEKTSWGEIKARYKQ